MEPTPCCLKSSIYNFLCVGTHQHDIIYYAPSVLPTSISASCHKTYPTKRRRLYSAYGICILCFYVYWVYSSRVYILPFLYNIPIHIITSIIFRSESTIRSAINLVYYLYILRYRLAYT